MPPKRKATKQVQEAGDAGLKRKRIDKEEFADDVGEDIDAKQIENVKPKRGGRAVEQKPAVESKSRSKGKAPPTKSTKKEPTDAAKPNLDEGDSDSSTESKKDAPVKSTKKNDKKVPVTESKRKGRGVEGPSAKAAKLDKEASPDIEEDEDDEAPKTSTKASKAAPKAKGRAKATQSKAKGAKKNEVEDVAEVVPEEDVEPETAPEEEPKKKTATKASKKIIAVPEVIENEEVDPQDSSEDEQPKKKITTAKATKKNVKKHPEQEVEPDDASSDESSKKKAPVSKRGKRNVKKVDHQEDESEPEEDASGDSKKKAPAEKASKKEVIPEEGSGSEDVSSDDSKKKVPTTKGAKKNVKTASKGRPAKTAEKKERLNATETSYEGLDFSCDKKNKAGDVYNLRIASWNVDGVRAWAKKDGLQYVLHEKPDIFCISETKCNSENFPEEFEKLEDYKMFWHSSSTPGYAGVSLWSLKEPIEVQYGIGNEEQDQDGRCITAEFEKYYVVSVYVPNSGRGLVTLPKRLEWNKAFKNFVKELDAKKPVIICGDLNVAHSEIDLANPKTNTKTAGFTPEEREGMTEFLSEGFFDTYRNFYPDTTGEYTFWTYMGKVRSRNIGWRLDYFLASNRLKDNLCDSLIRSSVLGSDHCPIVLFLNI